MFFLLIYHLAKTDYSFHKCKGERSIRHLYFLIVLNVCPCMLSLAPATKDGYLIWDQMSSHCHFARKVRCIVSADYTICEEATWKLPFVLPLNPSNSVIRSLSLAMAEHYCNNEAYAKQPVCLHIQEHRAMRIVFRNQGFPTLGKLNEVSEIIMMSTQIFILLYLQGKL